MLRRGLGTAGKESMMDEKQFREAVEWVRHWFGWQLIPYPDGRPPVVTQLYERSRVVGIASDIRDGHLGLEAVIERSRAKGGTQEWDGLALLSQWLLHQGDPLPAALSRWLAAVLAGSAPRQAKSQRPSATARQIVVIDAIEWAIRAFDVQPTRSNAATYPQCCFEQGSGCDIVGFALGDHMAEWRSVPPSYKTIESLWLRRGRVKSRAARENPPPRRERGTPIGTHYQFEYHQEPPRIEYDEQGNPRVITPSIDEIWLRAVVRTQYDDCGQLLTETRTEYTEDGRLIGSEK